MTRYYTMSVLIVSVVGAGCVAAPGPRLVDYGYSTKVHQCMDALHQQKPEKVDEYLCNTVLAQSGPLSDVERLEIADLLLLPYYYNRYEVPQDVRRWHKPLLKNPSPLKIYWAQLLQPCYTKDIDNGLVVLDGVDSDDQFKSICLLALKKTNVQSRDIRDMIEFFLVATHPDRNQIKKGYRHLRIHTHLSTVERACLEGIWSLYALGRPGGGLLNMCNKEGSRVLHITELDRYMIEPVYKLLLEHGASVNSQNNRGQTPLHCAAITRSLACVELLLEHNADQSIKDYVGGSLALHYAAFSGSSPCMRALLKQSSVYINNKNVNGQTPLHVAAQNKKDARVVVALLRAKADPACTDNKGNLPIHYAAGALDHFVMHALIGADGSLIDATNNNGETPLYMAAKNGNNMGCAALLANGADMYKDGPGNVTPLQCAIQQGHSRIIKLLQNHTKNHNTRCKGLMRVAQ